MKILLCFGTRPEAIKVAPIYHELISSGHNVIVVVTAQHREMLDQVLDFFEIVPHYDLNLMQPNQSLNSLCASIISEIDKVFLIENPDLVLVHGDTSTSSMVALSAFHRKIRIGHIEAGLRTHNKFSPFPEEINRQLIAKLADYHFAPTKEAVENLKLDLINDKNIYLVGNSVIDALELGIDKLNKGYQNEAIEFLKTKIDFSKKIILVTGHRRENFGSGIVEICHSLLEISNRNDVFIVFPVHLNPNVLEPVHSILKNKSNILLIEPVEYPAFIWLMQKSFFLISDSGGIQEEAPTFGKPVLVTREVTERIEGVDLGLSFLVGTDKNKIVNKAIELLDLFSGFENKINPYGDGKTAKKIVKILNQN